MWSWGPLESQRRLPRVRYGRVILARAQWNLPKSEVEALRAQEGAAWLHTLRGRDYGILREMFPDLRSDIVSAPEGRFVNEIVVPVLRKSGPAVRGATGPRCSPPCTRIALRPFPTPTDPAIGAPLVRQSGGRLDAESQGFGRGATFSLYLPAAQRR